VLNRAVPEALGEVDLRARGITVLHQTGALMRDEVDARYRALGVTAEVTPFIEDMASAYASAALVICRAGATTVAELCALGRPAILVPYPHAADDHQGRNAESLSTAGAAVCIREGALTREGLSAEVERLLADDDARAAMADRARALGKPDAAAAIVDDLFAWLGHPHDEVHDKDAPHRHGSKGGRGGPSGTVRRSSVAGRVPYRPGLALAEARHTSSQPRAPRPALMVGWGE
jgi:UDP-N-acetylglucosamine--N-acetylmuramyl-(pentapeptide) pyrophosphoryl-undecaprenol N-acetylglucosamine transferase